MSLLSGQFPKMTTALVLSLLAYPKTQPWVESLEAWCEWHVHQVRREVQARVRAFDKGNRWMWKYHQAWVELHEAYVELYRALIDADANAWAKLDQAKRAQTQVDFLCLEWIQSEYPTEMTEALAEVQAKQDHARAHAHANHPPEKKELDESHFSFGYIH